MNISDWVHTSHNMNKITGFITEIVNNEAVVYVTRPKDCGELKVKFEDLLADNTTISPDDIPMLIDLSLALKDEQWFKKWTNELNLWREPQFVFEEE